MKKEEILDRLASAVNDIVEAEVMEQTPNIKQKIDLIEYDIRNKYLSTEQAAHLADIIQDKYGDEIAEIDPTRNDPTDKEIVENAIALINRRDITQFDAFQLIAALRSAYIAEFNSTVKTNLGKNLVDLSDIDITTQLYNRLPRTVLAELSKRYIDSTI